MAINLELPKLVFFRNPDTRKMFVDKFDFLECVSDVSVMTPETAIIVDDAATEAHVDMKENKGVLTISPTMLPDMMIKLRNFIDSYKLSSDAKIAANDFIESLAQTHKESA